MVRPFFETDSAVISPALAKPGELTQGLCSPWQNDYRECSCYYWASARPDYVNIEPTPSGASRGDNWMQKVRTGEYVADDYVDTRLLHYDELFTSWESVLKFQVGGRDVPDPLSPRPVRARSGRQVPIVSKPSPRAEPSGRKNPIQSPGPWKKVKAAPSGNGEHEPPGYSFGANERAANLRADARRYMAASAPQTPQAHLSPPNGRAYFRGRWQPTV